MSVNANFSETEYMERIDICSLLCNLLDNAMEACQKIANPAISKEILFVYGLAASRTVNNNRTYTTVNALSTYLLKKRIFYVSLMKRQ